MALKRPLTNWHASGRVLQEPAARANKGLSERLCDYNVPLPIESSVPGTRTDV